MAKTKADEALLNVLQDILIVQLALSGVDNHRIRRIAGVQMSRVTRISKVLGKRIRTKGAANG